MDTPFAHLSPRERYVRRLAALKTERSSWIEHWREIAEALLPRAPKFDGTKPNDGTKKHQRIVNSTPVLALRTLSAGMMAGITSPARPWFRIGTPDAELNEFGSVKQWLHLCEDRIRQVFAKSNIYNQLHTVYEGLGSWGTCPLHVDEDVEDVIRGYVYPVGQYCLTNSFRLAVDTSYRELPMTVGQVVQQFGLERCSLRIQQRYHRGEFDGWERIAHVIEPNTGYVPGRLGPEGMRFKSCWFEVDGDINTGTLRDGGYEEFPVLAPRWKVSGEDVYGTSPAMEALGDCRALQLLEKRKAEAMDKIVRPPMRGNTSLMHGKVSILPGDTTFADSLGAGRAFEPAMEVSPQALPAVGAEIMRHEDRIKSSFFADLWLALQMSQGPQMTAREVMERHEEKLLQLGPVMERLNDELLDPLIERTFGIMLRRGLIPEPPEELQGMDLKVEHISIAAQAQKMLGIGQVERIASFVGGLAAAAPDTLDKLDFDQMVDEYGNMLGVPPNLIRTDEAVAELRAQRAEAAQQAQQAQAAMGAAQGAKVLSETDTSSDNALTRILDNMGGLAAATGRGSVQ